MGNPAGKSRANPSGGQPRNLAEIEARQLRQLEIVRKRLDRVITDNGPDWMPSAEFLETLHANADVIVRLSRGIRLGRESDQRHLERMTDEQLDAVFMRELPRLAMRFTADQWSVLDRVRGQQAALAAAREATEFAEGNKAAAKEHDVGDHEVLL